MKNKILIIIAVILSLSSACTSDFEEINTNPNALTSAPLGNMLIYTEYILANQYGGTELLYPAAYTGHASKYRYLDAVKYTADGSGNPWDYLYVNMISNLNFIINEAEKAENPNMKAAAMVLKAYAFHLLVDIYGPIPYSEANRGTEGIIFPKFDSEKDIYYDLLEQLKIANNTFDHEALFNIGSEDQIFAGDSKKWQKFCNSLRLRLAMRISNVPEATTIANNTIKEILNNPAEYPILESNDDNVFFDFPDEDPNYKEPWSSHSEINLYRIGKPLVDKLNEFNDPRREIYADSLNDGTYAGIEIGAESPSGVCRIDDRFSDNDGGAIYFMKYCEVEFLKAEAFQRNIVSGDAQSAYENGITASFEEYNIGIDTINTYLAQSGVAWNNNVDQIYIQKWISLFHQSWEAWSEMRRTDVPNIPLAISDISDNGTHNRVPFRFNYPTFVKDLNSTNIPDYVNEVDYYWGYQIWWDTRSNVY